MEQGRMASMEIKNLGPEDLFLTEVRSSYFQRIEIHKFESINGFDTMSAVGQVLLASHSALVLSPAGYHFMLYRPRQRLVEGEEIPLVLVFSNGLEVRTKAMVSVKGSGHHHSHQH